MLDPHVRVPHALHRRVLLPHAPRLQRVAQRGCNQSPGMKNRCC